MTNCDLCSGYGGLGGSGKCPSCGRGTDLLVEHRHGIGPCLPPCPGHSRSALREGQEGMEQKSESLPSPNRSEGTR